MANHKSALKRMRQNARLRAQNRSTRSKFRTEIKKFRQLATKENKDQAEKALPGIVALIDQSRKKGIIHENKAARCKSRLTRLVNSLPAE